MSVITIDHDRAEMRNVALMEIGLRLDEHEPPTADVAERFLEAANFTASASHAAASTHALTKLARTDPDRTDACLGWFFGGGCRDHLAGLHAPVVRIGHPRTPEDRFRLDLEDTVGVVVGSVRRAWLDGPQLRGDVVLIEHPPMSDWPDVRAALLNLAAERPEALGISSCTLATTNGHSLPVALDLVNRPACNRNGLLGLSSNGATHPPIREVGRRRTYWPEVVYEAFLESWLAGGRV